MTEKTLRKANEINNNISNIGYDLKAIDKILADYDNFGSELTFKRNSDGYSKSFGSKKFYFKYGLKDVLLGMKVSLEDKVQQLKTELEEL